MATTTLPQIEPMTGRELRAIREEIGLSQEKLAQVLDCTSKSVHRWETRDRPVDPVVAQAVRSLRDQWKDFPGKRVHGNNSAVRKSLTGKR